MRGGDKALLASVALAIGGCASDDAAFNVRATADPLAAASKRGSPMLVEGRAALALGNTGTALEAFRKALRQQPDSIEALAGIAACYERMGRYDLSRVNYEAALAIAPNNPILLNSFAASLQLQGRAAEANALRAEAAQAQAALAASTLGVADAMPDAAPSLAPVAVPTPTATAALPAAPPVPVMQRPVAPQPQTPSKPAPAPEVQAKPIHTEVVGTTTWTIEVPKAASAAKSVTVALPPAREVEVAKAPAKVAAAPPPAVVETKTALAPALPSPIAPRAPVPAPRQPDRSKMVVAINSTQNPRPRLQRLSMGEVALLTGNAPAWRTEVVAQTQNSVTARFVPLKSASAGNQTARFVPLREAMAANRPNVRLLNAARRQGLAARTRETLLDRGWRKIAIGDAPQVRARSIVLYPANKQALGKRVAAQFGFASAVNARSDEVLVLLGRDAAAMSFRRARG